ncbi:3'-5' exonuclease [Deinococcus maricopensis]|uniref:Exonuclease RNase T and DNA polymerase III n=1 Tax=Deinococcus maricopensis (strain DSM 21211 / LMG 22137 / NRRL B-23946 / LB-34) TaxID=709986 RepID=E8U413_DEIML|nr:3'-5' exonuclease [Deinococcus maricopensis]ADV65707.1 Exonuclease RNase T and DNA polymerase III [Deinococcus maricopensis DSM 21211]
MSAQPIIFLDTETGGMDPAVHPLLTVGLVTLQDGEITRPLHLRVRHDTYTVDPEAMRVNGIDLLTHHDEAHPPAEVAAAIRAYAAEVGRVMLGGHNFAFDLGFLRTLLPDRSRVFRCGHVDTKTTAQFLIHAGILPKKVGTALDQLAKHFGIEYQAHDALEDARTTAIVYNEFLKLVRAAPTT